MGKLTYSRRSRFPMSRDALFRWHERSGALMRLLPPWEMPKVEHQSGGLEVGAIVKVKVPVGPLWVPMTAKHTAYEPGHLFVDEQERGPMATWRHEHRFEDAEDGQSELEDSVEYSLPLSLLSHPLAGWFVRRKVDRMFRYRHAVTQMDLARHAETPKENLGMKVAITGATGMIGGALVPFLSTGGHDIVPLNRAQSRNAIDGGIEWDPKAGTVGEGFEETDAVVHLAGESVVGRWSDAKKKRILESRVAGTRTIVDAMVRARKQGNGPRTLITASAIGYYPDSQDALDESAGPGADFLSEVCKAWEDATVPATDAGIRVVNLRIGIVLSPVGGALKNMLPPFKAGVGGRIGSGEQYISWIGLNDLLGVILFALGNDKLSGPVNATAPAPVTNAEFTRTLAGVLSRPALLPVPRFALKAALGEFSTELLTSHRVLPTKLQAAGFEFQNGDLRSALRHELGLA